jgi:sugar phosphate isomerase/epimerase
MTLVLDAGALIAVEWRHREVLARIKAELDNDRIPLTHGGIVGQVWRSGTGRQAELARLLRGVDVAALDEELGKRAGVLLGKARTSDVIDAALIMLATDGDEILTSDADDLRPLAEAAGVHVELQPV